MKNQRNTKTNSIFSFSRKINPARKLHSSMTVEAALCLSLFIFASVVLMMPLLMIHQQRNISRALEQNARLLSKLHYIEYVQSTSSENSYSDTDKDKIQLSEELLHSGETVLSAFLLEQQLSKPLLEHLDLLTETEIDIESIQYVANYDFRLPFSVLSLSSLPQQVISSRRAWIGAEGNRWMDQNETLSDDDPVVFYSTRESNVYHSSLSCSYISHDILTASGSQMSSITPKYGGHFHPCLGCRPSKNTKTVYYTAGGRSYHATVNCKTLSSYIQEMPLSKAKALGKHACVRCGH